jgi:hypothetical protein
MPEMRRDTWSMKAIALARGRPLAVAVVALLLGMLMGSAMSSGGGRGDSLEADLAKTGAISDELRAENSELSAQNAGLQGKIDDLNGELASLKSQVVALESQQPAPAFTDLTLSKARDMARRNDWTLVVTKKVSSEAPGMVLSQKPAPGTVLSPSDTIKLVVAKAAPPPPEPEPEPTEGGGGGGAGCTPGYSPCLPPAPDYDCAGGSGDGPKYTGRVTVTGSDPYGLDSDGDGVGCD